MFNYDFNIDISNLDGFENWINKIRNDNKSIIDINIYRQNDPLKNFFQALIDAELYND